MGALCCLYIYFFYDQLVDRGGILLKITLTENFIIPIELIIGICGILILLEATRRAIGYRNESRRNSAMSKRP